MLRNSLPTLMRCGAFALLLAPVQLHATDYHVSPTGNDGQNGTSPNTAWRTIARVNQLGGQLGPGDRILFQRGGTYRGRLVIQTNGTTSAPIQVGAYGEGDRPVISGSEQVTGWTLHAGQIWKADITAPVQHLFHNGQLMTLARYPNSGWLWNDIGTSTSTKDEELTQANGYWNGATMVMRTTNWSYDTAHISQFNASTRTLTHSSTGNNIGTYTWGYFLRNKLSELDMPGEWFHDRAAGVLYFHCPDNADPNTRTIEAAVVDNGIYVSWQRNNIRIQDLAFRHQTEAALRLSGSTRLEASHCTFSDLQQAIRSTGSDQSFHHLDIQRTYSTAVQLLDNNTVFEHNTIRNVCLEPGLGESNWGYFGLRSTGSGMVIRRNLLENVGYIGIVAEQNSLVEKNVVRHALAILNDGGGIALDNADGMVVQDNVISDIAGDLSSSAANFTNYHSIAYGIYFGNISIRNTTVQRNSVSNCLGSGIHVDHTMVSSGNKVKDNILFNNAVQLSISDFSNYNTPGGSAPFHVPTFNTEYSGNVMYCLDRDQLCMRQLHVYSANWVDYGTFENNYYFNPYNDRTIMQFNTFAGVRKYFTLERWRADRGKDHTSRRSPLALEAYRVIETFGDNLVPNGTFQNGISGWSGWPAQGQMSHQPSLLDDGALKVVFNNNSTYHEFTLKPSTTATIESGAWYRMRFSIQSDMHGELKTGFKANSQVTGPQMVHSRFVSFDDQRRDVTMHFRSDLTDAGTCTFTNHYTEGTYWIDNVELQRVSVEELDPLDRQQHFVNDGAEPTQVQLTGCWSDVRGDLHTGTLELAPFSSIVLVREEDNKDCALINSVEDEWNWSTGLEGILYPNPVEAGAELRFDRATTATARITLTDMAGKLVWEGRLPVGSSSFRTPSGLRPATYVVSIMSAEQQARQLLVVR